MNCKYNYGILFEKIDNDYRTIFSTNNISENDKFYIRTFNFLKKNKMYLLIIGYKNKNKINLDDKLLHLLQRNL